MTSILQFVKDWVPSLAVLTGGIWIFIKWVYEEKQRKKREIPSLDGKLTVTHIPVNRHKQMVTVEGLWINHSPFPIYLNIDTCEISIYSMPERTLVLNQPIIIKEDLGQPVCSSYFLKKMVEQDYFFEPNTESIITSHFVLEPGLYGIRMVLYGLNKGEHWWKEKIMDLTPAH